MLYLIVTVVGILVGLEIPLLMRILKERFQFHDLVAHVLTFDYLGALGASLLFPLLLVPHLGLVRSALLFGMINAVVALWSTFLFRESLGRTAGLRAVERSRTAGAWSGNVSARTQSPRQPTTTFTPMKSSSPVIRDINGSC